MSEVSREEVETQIEAIIPKRKVNPELWESVKKNLEGSENERLDAIKVLLRDHYSLPEESIELLKKLSLPDNPLEIRLAIVQALKEFKSIPFGLYSELVETLRKDPDLGVKEIADQLYQEEIERINKTWQVYLQSYNEMFSRLQESISYPAFSLQKQFLELAERIRISAIVPKMEFPSMYLFPAVELANQWSEILAKNLQQVFLNYYQLGDLQILTQPFEISEESPSFRLKRILQACPPGKHHWRDYQDACKQILTHTLVPPLLEPLAEAETSGGIQRRDLIFHIPHEIQGFWHWIKFAYSSLAMIVECKNYANALSANEVVITSKYFGRKRLGLFGMIVTRIGLDRGGMEEQKRLWNEEDKMIICLNNENLIKMLELKDQGEDPSKVIDQAIRSFRQSLA